MRKTLLTVTGHYSIVTTIEDYRYALMPNNAKFQGHVKNTARPLQTPAKNPERPNQSFHCQMPFYSASLRNAGFCRRNQQQAG